MKFKDTISFMDRVTFVNRVMELCVAEAGDDGGVPTIHYAVFDYAFLLAAYGAFVDNEGEELTDEELDKLITSNKFVNELYGSAERSLVLDAMNVACEKQLELEAKKMLVQYEAVYHPDPLERVADMVAELIEKAKPLLDEENVVAMLGEMHAESDAKRKPKRARGQMKR